MKKLLLGALIYNIILAQPVEKIIFSGNRRANKKTLAALVPLKKKSEFKTSAVEEGVQNITEFYHKLGFIFAKVNSSIEEGKKGVIVKFHIIESLPPLIETVRLVGFSKDFKIEKLKIIINKELSIQLPKSYNPQKIEEARIALTDFYKNQGYYYAQITSDTQLMGDKICVIFNGHEGNVCYIKRVNLEGLKGIRQKTVKRIIKITPNEKYSEAKLAKALSNLYASNLFQRVYYSVSPEPTARESLNVVFHFVPQKDKILALGFGYVLPPTRLLFSVETAYLNFLNRGQEIRFASELIPDFTFRDFSSDSKLIYRVPYFAMEKIDFLARPFLFYEQNRFFKKLEIGQESGFYRDLTANFQMSFTNRWRRIFLVPEEGVTNSLIFRAVYDNRDNFFAPKKGFYFAPVGEVAGGLLGGNNDFKRVYTEFHIFNDVKLFILATRVFVGTIDVYGRSDSVPGYEKYTFGGRNSLRGFGEKEFQTDRLLYQNIETRFLIYRNLSGIFFFDWALARTSQKLLKSFGLGFRFMTPIGPLRLDYAHKTTDLKPLKFGKIYFGLGNVF